MSYEIDFKLRALQSTETEKHLNSLITKLKDIDTLANGKNAKGGVLDAVELKKIKELLKDVNKESAKTSKEVKETNSEYNKRVEILKAEIRLQGLKDKKLKGSMVLATKHLAIIRSGKKLTEQQVLELKKLENVEKKILATKKKDTVAKDKERLIIAKQLHDLKIRGLTLGERDIFNVDQNKYINQMKEHNRQLLAGNRLTEQQVRDLRLLDATQRNNIRTQDTVVSNLATIRMAYTSLAKVMRVVSASTRKISEIDKSMFNLGVVTGKTSYEIEGLRTRMLEMAHDSPISGSALADSADLIARTGCRKSARYKKSFFMLGSLKVA